MNTRPLPAAACALALAALAGCMTAPADLDLSLQRTTQAQRYVVALQPPPAPPPINRIHAWQITLRTPEGAPVTHARIAVDGGMPQHGHGLPTRPQVTQELSAGTYLLEGMKFSMTGWWEIRLSIDGAQGRDAVTFNHVVADPPVRREAGWSAEEARLIASLALDRLAPPPSDPSNAVDGDPDAVALGRTLFHDPRTSRDGSLACASCHLPERQFQDDRPVARGVGTGTRRAMTLVGAGHHPWFFWDGRKDSLWAQALGPLEDGAEHGSNRARLAHLLHARHRPAYERVFGPMPPLAAVPADASPIGTPDERLAWQAMAPAQRAAVDRVFANLGKAIAAYEKRLAYGESRFDRYARELAATGSASDAATRNGPAPARGDVLSAQEVNGLRVFIGRGQCATCHNGPLFTDQHFHNTGVPPRDAARPDRGRAAAVERVQADPFNCLGAFSDARPAQCAELRFLVAGDPALEGAFRTPGLRNVALRPPYMHAGQFATLDEVVRHYVRAPAAALGRSELSSTTGAHGERAPIRLAPDEVRDLVAFLATLSGPIIETEPR